MFRIQRFLGHSSWYSSSRSTRLVVARELHVLRSTRNAGLLPSYSPSAILSIQSSSLSSQAKREEEPQKQNKVGLGITVARKKGKATGYCYGCGASLVKTTDGQAAGAMDTTLRKTGYWATKQEELKKSKLKNWALCDRCRTLQAAASRTGDLHDLGPDSRMTRVFRTEVAKIRQKPNAVVILCVDSINVYGTWIRTIRNYVGGNPILVAITRCDLLPDYVWEATPHSEQDLCKVYAQRTGPIMPAKVYLCSIPQPDNDTTTTTTTQARHLPQGTKQLFEDLDKYLDGRDPYIIGAANIGKSTLTDALIRSFLGTWANTRDRLGKKRQEKLQTARVTQSALPGTTLQNVRVPCFADHQQALWDTPGLLLDESLTHFPIRDLQRLRAQRPRKIEPVELAVVDQKAFSLVLCERGDDFPLVRFDVRLKKNRNDANDNTDPVRLIWNSIWNLDAKIMDIGEAHEHEKERTRVIEEKEREQEEEERRIREEVNRQVGVDMTGLSKEERVARRRKLHEEWKKQEMDKLGKQEWYRRQKERKAQSEAWQREKKLSKLTVVHRVVLDGGYGTDIVVSNFGWLGVLLPSTAMIATFAPSSGVQVTDCATLALPKSWGKYSQKLPEPLSRKGPKSIEAEDNKDYALGDEFDDEFGDEFDDEFGDEFDDEFGDEFGDVFGDEIGDSYEDYDVGEGMGGSSGDPWEKYSGEHVGWQFDNDLRYFKGELVEGWNPLMKDEPGHSSDSQRGRKGAPIHKRHQEPMDTNRRRGGDRSSRQRQANISNRGRRDRQGAASNKAVSHGRQKPKGKGQIEW